MTNRSKEFIKVLLLLKKGISKGLRLIGSIPYLVNTPKPINLISDSIHL